MTGRPLRFCMITTFYPPYNFGGDGIFIHRLSNELARKGHKVDVIHCIDSYRLLSGREPEGTYDDHPNVTVHGLRSKAGILSPLVTQQTGYPLLKSSRIRDILKKGFDVINYHNISLVGGPKVLEYGRAIKLYTMHEYWLVCPTHLLFRFNRDVCRKKHCILCSLTYKIPPQWWRYTDILKKNVKHVDAFIAMSHFCKDIHQKMGLELPVRYLPSFSPSEGVQADTSEETGHDMPERPYFLFAGRLEKLKGLQTLILLFRHYGKADLLIAGTGSDETEFKKLAQGIPNIHFLGQISGARLRSLYRQAAALIVSSVCFEISPLVIMEAFREKTPVIVRNMGGMPESIKESGGGLVYETDEDLTAAMDSLLENRSYRDELGLLGHQAYTERWTAEAHVKQYLELISNISDSRRNSQSLSSQASKRTDRL